MSDDFNVLIAITGSVASVKLPLLVEKLCGLVVCGRSLCIRVVATEHSKHFFDENELAKFNVRLYRDKDEWNTWKKMSDPVLHIELRKWAHLMLIAPIDANTLAKVAMGLCDNLLSCIIRAWDLKKPLLFCPAMNTFMWEHPITKEHVDKLVALGYIEIPVVSKKLACGDIGYGGMAEVNTIVDRVKNVLENTKS